MGLRFCIPNKFNLGPHVSWTEEFEGLNIGPKEWLTVITAGLSLGRDAKMYLVPLRNWCSLSCSCLVIPALELSMYSSLSKTEQSRKKRNFKVMPKSLEEFQSKA